MSAKSKRLKNQSQRKASVIQGQSENQALGKYCENFRVSFEYLDKGQGQTFKDWEEAGLLAKMNETLFEYCKESIRAKMGTKFKEYGEFPGKTNFRHPKHVEPDVNWCSLHVTGKAVLVGFISGNTFFVVFWTKTTNFGFARKSTLSLHSRRSEKR